MTTTKSKPPSIWLLLGLVIVICIGHQLFAINPPEAQLQREYATELCILGGNSVKSGHIDYTPQGRTIWREVSAFNAVPAQTDHEPCISASGMNICETRKLIAASNEFPFGTRLMIDGRIYYVEDRMNSRYNFRIDLLMAEYQDAKNWGIKVKEITLLD